MSLKREVGLGLFWTALATIGSKVLALLRKLILARLLVPDDFGLVGYATLTIGVFELFMELGFSSALIYRKDDIEEAANTTFYAVLLSSVGLYIAAYFMAPLVATFFRNDALVSILRVLSLTLVISAFSQVSMSLLAKGMGFKNRVIPEMIASTVGSALSVILALLGYGVWSIVYGQLITTLLMAVLVWFYCPWRPSFSFSTRVAKELWQYGRHIIGSQVMVFLITNIDDAFVGRMLGDASLGTYGLAYELSNYPATHLSRIVGRVLFPAFSKVQNDLDRLCEVFFKSMKYVALAAFPISLITLVFAKDFMVVAYGLKWSAAIVPLQWLTIYGLARAIAVNMGNVFKASGKPKWLFYIATVRVIAMAALIYPAIKWKGITGVAILSSVVSVIDFALSMLLTNRVIRAPWRRYAAILVPMAAVSTLTAFAGHWFYSLIETVVHPFIALPLAGGLALVFYLGIMYASDADIRKVTSQIVGGLVKEFRRFRIAQESPRA